MDVLSHFRNIEELTKTLSREHILLSQMFEKRKLIKFRWDLRWNLLAEMKQD